MSKCQCNQDSLLINLTKHYSKGKIEKIANRLKGIIIEISENETENETQLPDFIRRIDQACVEITTGIQYHNCQEIADTNKKLKETIKQYVESNRNKEMNTKLVDIWGTSTESLESSGSSSKTDKSVSELMELDQIVGHYYKSKKLKFRCQWKNHDLLTFHSYNEIQKWPIPIGKYLKEVGNKAKATMVTRETGLLNAIRLAKPNGFLTDKLNVPTSQ